MVKISKRKEVTVYTTPTCTYCVLVKQFLKENKVPFREIDVMKDQQAMGEMLRKSGQLGVPVIDVNGQILVGFNREALKRALHMKNAS